MTRTRYRWPAAALIALLTAGCAPLRVSSYQWPGADFARYRTFTWGPQDRLSTGDPRLDNNQIFRERVQRAVERELTPRGLERALTGPADVVVHVHAHIDQRIETHSGLPRSCCTALSVVCSWHGLSRRVTLKGNNGKGADALFTSPSAGTARK